MPYMKESVLLPSKGKGITALPLCISLINTYSVSLALSILRRGADASIALHDLYSTRINAFLDQNLEIRVLVSK